MTYKGREFWVTNADSRTVTRVDADTLETSQILVGGRPANVRVGDDGVVWVTDKDRGYLQRIDPETEHFTNVPVGPRPYSVAITTDGVWVGDSDEKNIRLVKP